MEWGTYPSFLASGGTSGSGSGGDEEEKAHLIEMVLEDSLQGPL